MGGSLNHREPIETLLLEAYENIGEIFQQGGWLEYLNRLQGYDDNVALEFAINFREIRTEVVVVVMQVTENVIAKVIGLPQMGERWYCRRRPKPKILEQFLELGGALVKKGTGFDRTSLSSPWQDVAIVMQRYITCEGCYRAVYL
jgi:hypothetical protein